MSQSCRAPKGALYAESRQDWINIMCFSAIRGEACQRSMVVGVGYAMSTIKALWECMASRDMSWIRHSRNMLRPCGRPKTEQGMISSEYSGKVICKEEETMTQSERVLDYLKKYETISPMEAFSALGITKLATVISNMIRHQGIAIEKVPINVRNRYGQTCHVMSYRLKEE